MHLATPVGKPFRYVVQSGTPGIAAIKPVAAGDGSFQPPWYSQVDKIGQFGGKRKVNMGTAEAGPHPDTLQLTLLSQAGLGYLLASPDGYNGPPPPPRNAMPEEREPMSSIVTRRPSQRKGTASARRKKRLRKLLKAQEPRRMPPARR